MTGGSIRSHPDYDIPIDAPLEGMGHDYIRNDPDGKRMRLGAHAVAK